MILSVNNISKSFGENIILNNVSFFLNDYDKAALVGINGSGKSTLLKIIMGETDSDSGIVTFSKDSTIGYLPQEAILSSDNCIYDEVLQVKADLIKEEQELRAMETTMGQCMGEELEQLVDKYHSRQERYLRRGGDKYKSEIAGALKGLGFDEESWKQPVNNLSGGQKTRVALAKLLVGNPDIIILDEPTNHLDMNSIIWLETYLKNYKGTVLIVSHDRYFLDRIVNKIVEIENQTATLFNGNYSDYSIKKEKLRIDRLNAYMNQQRDIKHQQQVIEKLKSFNREKSIKRAESRQKLLDKVQVLEKPRDVRDSMEIVLTPIIESGKDVLSVQGLSKAYGSNILFENLEFELKKGEHVAIIGDNGTGKTTILKILNEVTAGDSGSFKLGSNVIIGYYDQEQKNLNPDKTIFQEIADAYPTLTNTEIRNVLAAFLFTGDDVFKTINSLSGGEKGRVSLARLMLSEANLIILDEPTNHLDITSREILENAVNNYTGTLLYVSHDRYFINRTADRILELKDGRLTEYLGDFDYYLEKKESMGNNTVSQNTREETAASSVTHGSGAMDYMEAKKKAGERRKLERELDKVENDIQLLEDRQKELDMEMAKPENVSNSVLLQQLHFRYGEMEEELLKLMDRWGELTELLQ